MLNQTTQTPSGNHCFENLKFATIGPQQMRMAHYHLSTSQKQQNCQDPVGLHCTTRNVKNTCLHMQPSMMKFGVRKRVIETYDKSRELTCWSKSVFFAYVQKCNILNSNGQMATNVNLKPLKHNVSDSSRQLVKQPKITKHDPPASTNVIHHPGARNESLEGPQTTPISNMI